MSWQSSLFYRIIGRWLWLRLDKFHDHPNSPKLVAWLVAAIEPLQTKWGSGLWLQLEELTTFNLLVEGAVNVNVEAKDGWL